MLTCGIRLDLVRRFPLCLLVQWEFLAHLILDLLLSVYFVETVLGLCMPSHVALLRLAEHLRLVHWVLLYRHGIHSADLRIMCRISLQRNLQVHSDNLLRTSLLDLLGPNSNSIVLKVELAE